MGCGFKKLLRFWVDEFETATSIRNERQHAFFSSAVRRGGTSGGIPSVQRVTVQDFGKHIFRDHEFKFGRQELQWNKRIRFAFNNVRTGVRQLKKEMKDSIKHRSGDTRLRVCHLPLGTGRTPWLHYSNKRLREARPEDGSTIPVAELTVLQQGWKREFDESAAIRATCKAEVDAARQARWNAARVERAHAFKDRRRNGRQAFVQNQPELPQPPALPIGPSIEAMNANTLWQLGNRYHAVRPSVIREEVTGGYSSLMKAAGSLKRDNKNVAELHNYCIPNNIARFNQKRISQWRSKMRSCSERHTGLCCQDAGYIYKEVLHFSKSMMQELQKNSGRGEECV